MSFSAANVFREVLAEDGSVERGDDRRRERQDLLQEHLHGSAVLAADVEIVAAGLAGPVVILFPEIAALGEGAELAERIGGEQDLVLAVETDHHFRPMHHRSHHEPQRVRTELEGIPFLHGEGVERLPVEELAQEDKRLRGGDDLDIRILPDEFQDGSGVVRFHVMDHQIVGFPAAEGLLQVRQPFCALAGVDRVHHGHFLVQDNIGIVRHPLGNDILAFKKVEVHIVDADVLDFGRNALDHVSEYYHTKITLFSGRKKGLSGI